MDNRTTRKATWFQESIPKAGWRIEVKKAGENQKYEPVVDYLPLLLSLNLSQEKMRNAFRIMVFDIKPIMEYVAFMCQARNSHIPYDVFKAIPLNP